ncbi:MULTISPECIES: lipoprotein signal peptidase [Petrimonas]|jgi:signal peptidase II|uniref:Lipoprotein signal peptidase n=1 Tax=Petrimonas mucosa TaxID=1642646 RepID=A0A1G4GB90_9BACT|nr:MULTISPECIES: lipoprotein signal peptidase [Petrimonas]SCM59816.1 Lipoprotein signal peptidase {ECO:0000255/HAMAP-Rule:MF_00161} [Petrimonas mucosa]SFU60900.1 signal peptidase II [Porphyromonadaceae bacterium KHP3R9]HHT28792.1 lipoprotein signal peptidase [Petrimonas mucosa]
MNDTTKKGLIAVTVVILVLLVDQVTKIWVKTHMALYDMIHITDWFKIYFVENNGMAFGIEAIGKLFLSLFRIVAVGAIIVYLIRIIRGDYKLGFIACIALVLAGASGNIIDSLFYGSIFQASYPGHVASLVPFGEGYASLLHGKVVDMFYFPLIEGTYPDWIPILGGKDFLFFRFIFNVADSAISVGVVLLLIFYRKTLSYSLLSKEDKERYDREKQEQPEKKIIRES